ncbi:MAG: class I SAM-dependent methyltransferase, partial [Pseudomonadota bacterium]
HEVDYINRQQGELCEACGANLRQIALSDALLDAWGSEAVLRETVARSGHVDLLDVNGAEPISSVLSGIPGYVRVNYPDVDMQYLGFEDASFDAVIHSDTLEHIPNPVQALIECRRVLRPGGYLCYTVPIVVGRMTRGRAGLQPSYHGNPAMGQDDFVVHTEFGADAWTHLAHAGFRRIRLHTVGYPAAIALSAIR